MTIKNHASVSYAHEKKVLSLVSERGLNVHGIHAHIRKNTRQTLGFGRYPKRPDCWRFCPDKKTYEWHEVVLSSGLSLEKMQFLWFLKDTVEGLSFCNEIKFIKHDLTTGGECEFCPFQLVPKMIRDRRKRLEMSNQPQKQRNYHG